MLDKRSVIILDYLIKNCVDGESVVVDKSDAVKALFPNEERGEELLKEGLEFLERGNYVKIKYFGDSRVFILLTESGRGYFEEQSKEREGIIKDRRRNFILVYIASVLGGVTGGMICELILRILGV